MQFCADALPEVAGMLGTVEQKTDDIGWKIQDKPELEPDEDIRKVINDSVNIQ